MDDELERLRLLHEIAKRSTEQHRQALSAYIDKRKQEGAPPPLYSCACGDCWRFSLEDRGYAP